VFPNAKIAGSRGIASLHVESKVQSMPNVMDHTRVSTTVSSLSAAKQTSRQTLQGLKQNKGNHVSILLSAQIVRAIIRQILTCIYSGSIGSTESGKQRNIKESMITRAN